MKKYGCRLLALLLAMLVLCVSVCATEGAAPAAENQAVTQDAAEEEPAEEAPVPLGGGMNIGVIAILGGIVVMTIAAIITKFVKKKSPYQ